MMMMKLLTSTTHAVVLSLSVILLLASCEKAGEGPITTGSEPDPIFVLASDSIGEGEMLGITIGGKAADVYIVVQGVLADRGNKHLHIVRPGFTDVEELKDRIHLYNHLLFDETIGTSQGVQVYFENDRIKSIWTNNGEQLHYWPADPLSADRLKLGDGLTAIFPKIKKLSSTSSYAKRFQRLSLSDKNAEKAYDPSLAEAEAWYFSERIDDKQFNLYHLYFDNGQLTGIKRELMGPYNSNL